MNGRTAAIVSILFVAFMACDGEAGGDVATPSDASSTPETRQADADAEVGPTDPYPAAARAALANLDASYFQSQLLVLADDAMLGRQNQTEGGQAARDHIIAQLQSLGVQPAGDNGGFEQVFAEGTNVLGIVPGTDPALADEFVLVSAHYDHLGTSIDGRGQCAAIGNDAICNGASDNASGVAGVLALVDALNSSTTGLKRSLLIVFWDAEEDGLLGSTHYVAVAPLVPLANLAAMFSVDIVGTRIIPGVEAAFGLGMDYSQGIRDVLHAVNAELGTQVYPVSMNFSGGDGGRSDHKPFQEAGVPVVFFGAGSSPVYHTAADNPEVVELELAMMLMRHVVLVTAELANGADRPSYVDGPSPHIDDAYALRDMGEAILADPSAVGLEDPLFVGLIEGWVGELQDWIDSPPSTPAEEEEYGQFVRSILDAVYAFL